MRIASKNRFSRVIIRKAPFAHLGSILKIDTSTTRTDQSTTRLKPVKGMVSIYDRRIIAGSAL
ncbi:hypothetical protein [Chitinophaga sancti]|uniref:Uncharacterized protein n=1 Tax=Chitinophaga sancti TaxID=1004 RepID=A0ABZ0XFQ4_9BACT|nr:hypothetical protein [Chitinophaga sancti]WQD65258.1 hypothetical protein U0033_12720 [Chitinophaga sancti]WQG89118.1 hypothetical protein SR876_29750 [Chitinophaga sancti]